MAACPWDWSLRWLWSWLLHCFWCCRTEFLLPTRFRHACRLRRPELGARDDAKLLLGPIFVHARLCNSELHDCGRVLSGPYDAGVPIGMRTDKHCGRPMRRAPRVMDGHAL